MKAVIRSLIVLCLVLASGCGDDVDRRPRADGGRVDGGGTVAGCMPTPDSDMDGIADAIESDGDADGDGMPNRLDLDSDGDGTPDAEEHAPFGPCQLNDPDGDSVDNAHDLDSDNDGLSDMRERGLGTDPLNIDTDGDGVTDLGEVDGSMTDPTDPTDTIPEDDFFVVLPYLGDRASRTLRFGTNIRIADVYFLLDTTGSMGAERMNIQNALETIVIPGVEALIDNVWFGAGGFDDFPVGTHGSTATMDLPFYHLLDVSPADQDIGAWAPGGPWNDVGQFQVGAPNGTRDIVDMVRRYPAGHVGGNGCESGVEAMYQTATGEGVTWAGGATPPKSCPSVPDEMGTRRGYPCFRPGALPIIVYISDAPLHEPLPAGWPLDTIEFDCVYSDVPTAHTYAQALDRVLGIGARVLTLSSDQMPSFDGYPATAQMCNIARDTGAVRADGSPLCFEIGTSGTLIGMDVVNAIAQLVGGTPQDVSTRTENVAGNPDGFDATMFIKSITPIEGYGPAPGTGYTSKDATTFYGVIPGTLVDFAVDFWNDVRMPAATAQIFRALIVVVGNGVTDLDQRNVYIIVPPEGGTILI
jgi:hypothetical protein